MSEIKSVADRTVPTGKTRGLRIDALGCFQVYRDGVPVPHTTSQSKKARDLLKILVSRRGRPIMRDELITALWPDGKGAKAKRLSVVLTALRSVLGGTGVRSTALVSEQTMVRLDLSAIDVDVERFWLLATNALEAWRQRDQEALQLLQTAAAAYTGEFCAGDPDNRWALPLREELAMIYGAVLRALIRAAQASDQDDLALQSLLTLLVHDPYDEASYLELVTALKEQGRHDDAVHHYQRYADRMAEIDIHPQRPPKGCTCTGLATESSGS